MGGRNPGTDVRHHCSRIAISRERSNGYRCADLADKGISPPEGLRSLPRVTISPTGQNPHPDLISTRAALDEFARAWREALARVENDLPDVNTVHLVASVPAPVAVAMGRYRMRTAQPKMVVYQLNDEGYEAAMEVTE